ncbi:MAG: peptidoglycan-binding domain 1 [Desulfobulbaceae bacterium]|nr:MAG: peptidoglycan-binding domain 1 [Desulfobulbaceae bacterium]
MKISKISLIGLTALTLLSSSCVESGMQMGSQSAKTVATGSAAGSATSGESSALEKCSEPLGTVSLIENQSAGWYTILTNQYKLPPTANLLRLMIQQSNCFVVVERGAAGMNAMSRERELQESGEMRKGSNFGKGQMVSSDYGLSPEIIFSEDNTGGMAGALGGLVGGHAGTLLGAVGGNTQTREASALLTMIDNRSGVQIAAAEGSASKTDIGGFGSLFGGTGGGAGGVGLSSYNNTPQGKVITAAFMDAYNNIVRSLRQYKAQEVKGGLGKGGQLKVGQ